MSTPRDTERDAIGLAERILAVLDEGRFSATYKFAVLSGLMDLCLENTTREGFSPDMVTTRQLAVKTIELYWPQTAGYSAATDRPLTVLRQAGNTDAQQADIVREIVAFRSAIAADPQCPLERARRIDPVGWRRVTDAVEWTLIKYPLPRVQRVGQARDEFLYTIGWDEEIKKSVVNNYQRQDRGDFDNRIQLRPGVGDALVRLHGLLRPLLQRRWALKIAGLNDLDVVRLEEHLFGSKRVSLDPVTSDLCLLHDHRCFYCDAALGDVTGKRVQIDHFIPWARHPDNAIENLVPAHERCNSQKRDFLAAGGHVQRWRDRAERRASDLRLIAERARFEHDPERVLSVARGIYLRLPARALLWVRGTEFEAVGSEGIGRLLVPPPEAGAG